MWLDRAGHDQADVDPAPGCQCQRAGQHFVRNVIRRDDPDSRLRPRRSRPAELRRAGRPRRPGRWRRPERWSTRSRWRRTPSPAAPALGSLPVANFQSDAKSESRSATAGPSTTTERSCQSPVEPGGPMYGHARFMPPVKAARESTTTSLRWFLRLARPRKMLRTGMNDATSPPAATSGARNRRLSRHEPKLSIEHADGDAFGRLARQAFDQGAASLVAAQDVGRDVDARARALDELDDAFVGRQRPTARARDSCPSTAVERRTMPAAAPRRRRASPPTGAAEVW